MGDYADDAVESALLASLDDNDDYIIAQRTVEQYEFVSVLHETPKAWQILMTGGARHWIPKSKCSISTEPDENGLFLLSIPHWLFKKKMEQALKEMGY